MFGSKVITCTKYLYSASYHLALVSYQGDVEISRYFKESPSVVIRMEESYDHGTDKIYVRVYAPEHSNIVTYMNGVMNRIRDDFETGILVSWNLECTSNGMVDLTKEKYPWMVVHSHTRKSGSIKLKS